MIAATVAPAVPVPQAVSMTEPNVTQQPQATEYIVQKGDTLGSISTREFGTAKKWESIYDANRDRLKSPTDLKIGKPLRIPHDG